jgi:hypothetical protein
MIAQWPNQSGGYRSALPGVVGPGLDVTAGDLPSKIYIISDYADTKNGGPSERGPNIFEGTFRYCWEADQGEAFSKWICAFIGGYLYVGRSVNSPAGRGNFDYVGHAAPGAGLVLQACVPLLRGGSNMRVWNMASWMGDGPAAEGVTNLHAGNRDALQASADGFHPHDVAFINCEARYTMDEGVQVFYAVNGISWIRGAVYDPLHVPPEFGDENITNHEPGQDHGYGHLIGGSDPVLRSLSMQSVYAHTTDRNPLSSATNHAQVNNLHYDHGRINYAAGAGLNISDNGGFNAALGFKMKCNLVGCIAVRGPNNNDSLVLAKVTGTIPVGSAAHSALNCEFGWTQPPDQDGFFTNKPADYMQPTIQFEAWPDGLGADYSGVLRPAIALLHPLRQEGLAFTQLMRTTVGMMPSRRYLIGDNSLNRVFDEVDNAIRGVESSSQWINTVEEQGGWPDVPFASVDPDNPGLTWWAPFPFGPERDEVLTEGFFFDGSPMAGYSRLRAWVINQYFYTLGR